MAYSGQAEKVFQKALLEAYPSRGDLEQFIWLKLGVNLEEVASSRNNLQSVVFDLVRWADRTDRTRELFTEAAAERPNDALVAEAKRHVDRPDLIETRWWAKWIPFATWLLGLLSIVLLLVLLKVWLVNLFDAVLWLFWFAVIVVVGIGLWTLINHLVKGPMRAQTGGLWRQLIAHSRLQRRDWLTFAAWIALVVGLIAVVAAAPTPIAVSFHRGPIGQEWDARGFVLSDYQFVENDTVAESQAPRNVRHLSEWLSRTFYSVEIHIASFNTKRRLTLEVVLGPSRSLDDGSPRSVLLAQLAVDRRLQAAFNEDKRINYRTADARDTIHETGFRLTLPFDAIQGRSSVVFTCQQKRDSQSKNTGVTFHARILDAYSKTVLHSDSFGPFETRDWQTASAGTAGDAAGLRDSVFGFRTVSGNLGALHRLFLARRQHKNDDGVGPNTLR